MVVLRCRDSHHATLERVLFPLQSLQFQFSDQGVAEVWTHGRGGAELLERCSMHELSCQTPLRSARPGHEASLMLRTGEHAIPVERGQ
jgi:hypothetical protein